MRSKQIILLQVPTKFWAIYLQQMKPGVDLLQQKGK